MKNKCLCLCLSLVFLFSFFSTHLCYASAITADSMRTKFAQLQTMYPNGSTWNGSYKNLSWQCMGWANTVCDYLFGENPRNWTKQTNLDNLCVGDHVRKYNYGYEHSIVITNIVGNTVYYADCNGKNTNKVRWNETTTLSEIKSSLIWFQSQPDNWIKTLDDYTKIPETPTIKSVTTSGNNITVTWNSVDQAAKYTVDYWNTSGSHNYFSTTETTMTQPFNNGEYAVRVSAENSLGASKYTGFHYITVGPKPTGTLYIRPNGGTWNGSAENQVFTQECGTTKSIATPVRPGYIFVGWDMDYWGTGHKLEPYGTPLIKDPVFSNVGTLDIYNLTYNGNVSITKVEKDPAFPMSSSYMMKITTSGTADPGLGGFLHEAFSKSGGVFYHVISAKIPVGYKIHDQSNACGDGASVEWLTPREGTGNWETYIYKKICGTTGSFSTFGYCHLEGADATASNPVTWYVGYSEIFDATGVNQSGNEYTFGTNEAYLHAQWRSNEHIPSKPTISLDRTTYDEEEKITFTMNWDERKNTDYYEFFIVERTTNTRYYVDWSVIGETYSLKLPQGKYYAYVSAINKNLISTGDYWTSSDPINFTVCSPYVSKGDFDGKTYLLFDESLSWAEANDYCKNLGGHLATVNSSEENTFLQNFIQRGSKTGYWIGGTDAEQEGVWKWITGEPFNYTDWYNGNPNNTNGTEHYLELRKDYGNKWNDDTIDKYIATALQNEGFICEFEYPQIKSTVNQIATSYNIAVNLFNINSGRILVAGYNDDVLVTMVALEHNEHNEPITFVGEFDTFKIMAWETMSNLKPLCDVEIITSDKFITQ
ncbi:MAG: lectin-like protein [Clostridia bacterium]|nr:lectin-like protein [Clostridia bacterium]